MAKKKTKVVILCGGQGSRIRDVADVMPKPMLAIGNRPILWHIMKSYAAFGLTDFVLCLGYKGWMIKEFFLNYHAINADLTVRLDSERSVTHHSKSDESNWTVTLADTGEESQTGTRVRLVKKYLEDTERFCLTYGDGVADVNLEKLMTTHEKSGRMATISGVHPSGRFGEIEFEGSLIREFNEKPNVGAGLINGGFMVFETKAIDKYFDKSKDEILEQHVIPRMVKDKQVGIYVHNGFWQCMDTPREYALLNQLWKQEKAPWKIWK